MTPPEIVRLTEAISAVILSAVGDILERRGLPDLTKDEWREIGERVGAALQKGFAAVQKVH